MGQTVTRNVATVANFSLAFGADDPRPKSKKGGCDVLAPMTNENFPSGRQRGVGLRCQLHTDCQKHWETWLPDLCRLFIAAPDVPAYWTGSNGKPHPSEALASSKSSHGFGSCWFSPNSGYPTVPQLTRSWPNYLPSSAGWFPYDHISLTQITTVAGTPCCVRC